MRSARTLQGWCTPGSGRLYFSAAAARLSQARVLARCARDAGRGEERLLSSEGRLDGGR